MSFPTCAKTFCVVLRRGRFVFVNSALSQRSLHRPLHSGDLPKSACLWAKGKPLSARSRKPSSSPPTSLHLEPRTHLSDSLHLDCILCISCMSSVHSRTSLHEYRIALDALPPHVFHIISTLYFARRHHVKR